MPVIQKNAPSSSQAFIPRASLRTLFLWYWLPALLWGAVIATFSGAAFGYSHTQSILAKVVAILHIHLSGYQLFFLHNMIRKTAHFTVYGVLSALVFRAFRANWPTKRRWQFSWATLALAVCLMGASADEFHQGFTPGRTGTWKDVVLDMAGALFAQTAIVIATAGNRNRRGGLPTSPGSSGGHSESSELIESLRLSSIRRPQFEDSSGS